MYAAAMVISFITVTGCDEGMQMVNPVVSEPSESAEEPMEPTTNGDIRQPETAMQETEPTIVLPDGYELPEYLIPEEPTVLSEDEQALREQDELSGWDSTAPNLQTEAGKTADLISLVPYKDREEVYDLFVASIDLPFFEKAARKIKEVNITLGKLAAEARRTGDWGPYDRFLSEADLELQIPEIREVLADIYFEENPEDVTYRDDHSWYWIYLEWSRLQLQYPDLDSGRGILDHFRESCKKDYIQGLDNPFSSGLFSFRYFL